MTRFILLCVFSLGLAGAAVAQSAPTTKDLDVLIATGEFPSAEALVDEIRAAVPDEGDAFNLLEEAASSMVQYSLYEEALEIYDVLMSQAPVSWLTPERLIRFQLDIALCYDALGQQEHYLLAANRLTMLSLHFMGQPKAGAYPEVGLEYVHESAKWFHLVAQASKNTQYMRLSAELYGSLGAQINGQEEQFYYAELLFAQNEYLQAAETYETYLKHAQNLSADRLEEVHFATFSAYRNLLARPTAECPATPPVPTALALPECHKRYIAAADAYIALGNAKSIHVIKTEIARVLLRYARFSATTERYSALLSVPEHSAEARATLNALKSRFCADPTQAIKDGWDGTPEALTALCGG